MQSFRVYRFRNILDSGEVRLDDDLTCVVGKNQSGKTSLLKALHKFNPRDPNPYNIRREWPRGERRDRDPDQVVCAVTFCLDDDEKAELADLATTPLASDRVVVTKTYNGVFETSFPEQPELFPDKLHPNDADRVCESLPAIPSAVGDTFQQAATACREEVRRLSLEGRFSDLAGLARQHDQKLRAAFSPGSPEPQHENESHFVRQHTGALNGGLQAAIASLPTRQRRAHEYVVARMPRFIYMDQYLEFAGVAQLDQLKSRRDGKSLRWEDETVLMILGLAGTDLDELVAQGASDDPTTIQERQFELDDAARSVSKAVAGRWGQKPYRIEFRADTQVFLVNIEELDKDVGLLPLEDQSAGFRWFFSFDLRFMHDSDGSFEGCVLLLDEPGLHLHPDGQEDLLRRLDAYAEKNTLIYTTHLPFLIDLREPGRIRVMSEEAGGAIVSEELNRAGRDEKLTLQAALGMKANRHYLVAPRNLVVEGITDDWLLTELSNLCERSGKPGLPEDVQVTAANGAGEAVYMATFMLGQNLQVVTLFDSDAEGRRQEEKLRKGWLTRYTGVRSQTALLGRAIGLADDADCTIEDLFPDAYYLGKVQESHAEKLKGAGVATLTLPQGGTLCNRAERACQAAGIQFNKDSVAKLIRRDISKMPKLIDLPKSAAERTTAERTATERGAADRSTAERVERLFQSLRSLLS